MTDIPWWVEESYETFSEPTKLGVFPGSWTQVADEAWSAPVIIHYPPRTHVFYVVDVLHDDGTWIELKGEHYIVELANNAAKRRAYSDGVPHRVRVVVSHE